MFKIGLMTNDTASGNFGVNALSISNLLIIEEVCMELGILHSFVLFAPISRKDSILSNIRSVPGLESIDVRVIDEIQFTHFFKSSRTFKKVIKECDIVFDTSGGDSFSDIYGLKRILHQTIPKLIAISTKKPLILTPQTIGPFSKSIWKKCAKRILMKCERVFVRDRLSYDYCINEMGYFTPIEVTDMAMILPYKKESTISDSKIKIGVNVSGLLYSGGYTEDNQFNLKTNYRALIDHLLKHLIDVDKYEIHLIPHVITEGVESDNAACEKIISKYPSLIYAGLLKGPIEAKSYISNMDLFIGSRMHSTIAALSAGIPCIPLSYSRKFEGLFSSIGYNESLNLRELSEQEIITKIDLKINNICELRKIALLSQQQIQERIIAYKSDLRDMLTSDIVIN